MSSIGSVSTSSLASYFQKLRATDSNLSYSQSTSSTSSTSSTDSTSSTQKMGQSPPPPPPGDKGDMGEKFNSALESQGLSEDDISTLRAKLDEAVTSAKDSDDPDAVRSAVDGVLQDAGVDLEEFNADMAPPADGEQDSSGIDSILQQAGIDPSEFKTKLSSLLASGSTDFSSLFAEASVGSSIDIAA